MTAAAVAGRAVRYNPTLRRHTWQRTAEHHKGCGWCGIHVENLPVPRSGRWYQRWDWPDLPGQPGGDNQDGGTVPACPGPTAAVEAASSPPPAPAGVVCPDCGTACAAELAVVDTTGARIGAALVDGRHPAGDLVDVPVDVGAAVRHRNDADHTVSMRGDRWRSHTCPRTADTCTVCGGADARMYPGGLYCATHTPATVTA